MLCLGPRLPLALALAFALGGCEGAGSGAPGGVSAGEAKELDEAAEMLDARRLPPEAVPTTASLPPQTLPPKTLAGAAAPADITGDAVSPRSQGR